LLNKSNPVLHIKSTKRLKAGKDGKITAKMI